jgi:hypothetical protein
MLKYFIGLSALIVNVSPAWADELYLYRDPSTQQCYIFNQKPEGMKLEMLGTKAYANKEEAKAARKAAKVAGDCKK